MDLPGRSFDLVHPGVAPPLLLGEQMCFKCRPVDLLDQTFAPMWQKQYEPRPLGVLVPASACYCIYSRNQLTGSCDIGLYDSSIDVVN